ncbi:calcium-binding protein [Shimia thalassica]|uniref:calcium-binding protein n=1 Tax=Shimia thalassica TaxID=1715693 RepID=UPI00273460EA|nr:hypothetical protein [Shimia thalassica]MDP2520270.1 hypothetical protein [Shimia thalassica]
MIISPSVVPVTDVQVVNTYGSAVGEELRYTTDPAVVELSGGGFVIVWTSQDQDGDGQGVFAQRFDDLGNRVEEEFQVNSFTLFDQQDPAVTALPDGGFIVVWESDRQDGFEGGIYGQRFDAQGDRVGSEFLVSMETQADQSRPDIISFADGSSFVAWQSLSVTSTTEGEIFGRGFAPDGTPLSTEYQLNVMQDGDHHGVSLATLGQSSFAATWYNHEDGQDVVDIETRVFTDLNGSGPDELWIGNTELPGSHFAPTNTIAQGDGTYFVFWTAIFRNEYGDDYDWTSAAQVDQSGEIVHYVEEITEHNPIAAISLGDIGIQALGENSGDDNFPDTFYSDVNGFRILPDLAGTQGSVEFEGFLTSYTGAEDHIFDEFPALAQLNNGLLVFAWSNYGDEWDASTDQSDVHYQLVRVNNFATGSVSFQGDAYVGETLTADPVGVDDPDGVGVLTYQWFRDGVEIPNATELTYQLVESDINQSLTFQLSFEDGQGTLETIQADNFVDRIGVSIGGSDADESLTGTDGIDYINGGRGNDTLNGFAGIDTLEGGEGNDQLTGTGILRGNTGDDLLNALQENDTLSGGDGNDTVYAFEGDDVVAGGNGNDSLLGEAGNDTLAGQLGDDFINAGDGDDFVYGGSGNDTLQDGAGNDVVDPGLGLDTISLGEGEDLIRSNAASLNEDLVEGFSLEDLVQISGATFYGDANVEYDGSIITLSLDLDADEVHDFTLQFSREYSDTRLITFQDGMDILIYLAPIPIGTEEPDTLIGTIERDWIEGLGGGDDIDGLEGNDTINGGGQADTIVGGDGDDLLQGQHGWDEIFGGEGADTLIGGVDSDLLYGGNGSDFLEGSSGTYTGSADARGDSLYGEDGDDTLYGGSQTDPLADDGVNDFLHGGNGSDQVFGGSGNDTLVSLFGNDILQGNAGNDHLAGGVGNDSLSGGDQNDTLYGEDGHDYLSGGLGMDILYGGTGHDLLEDSSGVSFMVGSWGNDTLTSGDENDTLEGNEGEDSIIAAGGDDMVHGGSEADYLDGGDGYDILGGQDGDDTIFGGTSEADIRDLIYGGPGDDFADGGYGNDELRGDAGNDTLIGDFGGDTLYGGLGNDDLSGGALGDLLFGGDGADILNGGWGNDQLNGGLGADRFFHLGVPDHGSDWVQDYSAAEGDVLLFGDNTGTASQFHVNYANTSNAGDSSVDEAFVVYIPTGQILWALIDGETQASINLMVGGQVFDILS